jgi:hypothetical protein
MSASCNERDESTPDQSHKRLKTCATTFEFYAEKFENFKRFAHKLAEEIPELGLWSSTLAPLSFGLFIGLVEQNTNLALSPLEELQELAISEHFDLKQISPEDLDKLERYITLFRTAAF